MVRTSRMGRKGRPSRMSKPRNRNRGAARENFARDMVAVVVGENEGQVVAGVVHGLYEAADLIFEYGGRGPLYWTAKAGLGPMIPYPSMREYTDDTAAATFGIFWSNLEGEPVGQLRVVDLERLNEALRTLRETYKSAKARNPRREPYLDEQESMGWGEELRRDPARAEELAFDLGQQDEHSFGKLALDMRVFRSGRLHRAWLRGVKDSLYAG